MLKLVGCCIIIITCGMMGLLVARSYRVRIEQLRRLTAGLKMLETEILYTATPLSPALRRVGGQFKGTVAEFFNSVSEALEKDASKGALTAWEKGISVFEKKGELNREDLDIIRSLGPMLGNSGVKDQVKNLELTRQLLGEQLAAAQEENNRKGKMWHTLGFLLGITLVLVLY